MDTNNMTEAQAKSILQMFCIATLNELSGEQGYEIGELEIQMNFNTQKTGVKVNGTKADEKKFATINDFNTKMRPVVDGEAKKRSMKQIDSFFMHVKKDLWLMEVFGVHDNEHLFSFEIFPVEIIPYFKK